MPRRSRYADTIVVHEAPVGSYLLTLFGRNPYGSRGPAPIIARAHGDDPRELAAYGYARMERDPRVDAITIDKIQGNLRSSHLVLTRGHGREELAKRLRHARRIHGKRAGIAALRRHEARHPPKLAPVIPLRRR